jgi:hypothetical protein
VHVLGQAPYLLADVALRDRVDPAASDGDDASLLDPNLQTARVRAVEGTDGGEQLCRPHFSHAFIVDGAL